MLVIANYKMNCNKSFFLQVNEIMNNLRARGTKIVLCPPFVYLPFFNLKNKSVALGAQNTAESDDKKYTGQISPSMLKEFGVKYVIVGHSECRAMGETEAVISNKVKNVITHGLTPVICIGEQDKSQNKSILKNQVKSALKQIESGKNIIFAYEPVWAIGTGNVPTVKEINKAIEIIKKQAKALNFEAQVLYGGSVNEANFAELKSANIDGFLIGKASLKLDEFLKIVKGV